MLESNKIQDDIIEVDSNAIDLERLNNLPQISFLSIKESLKKK